MPGNTGQSLDLVQIAVQNKGKRKTTKGLVYMRQLETLGSSGGFRILVLLS